MLFRNGEHNHRTGTGSGEAQSGLATVSHENEIRQVLRRLDRPATPPPNEGLPHKKGRPPLPDRPTIRIKKSPRLGTARDLAEAWAEGFPDTAKNPRTVAREFATLTGAISPHEITELHIRTLCLAWKVRLGRARRYLCTAYLRNLLRSIQRLTGRIDLAPAVLKAPRPQARTVIATPEELAALLHHAQPWIKTVILLATHAGLRRSDCLRIAPIHYDADRRLLTIEQKKTARTVCIPVTDQLAAQLERIQPETPTQPYVHAFHDGKSVSTSALQQGWQRLKKKAHVNRDLWIHDLRRTAAVSLYQLTKDLTAVEMFLGHNSLNSTCAYLEHKDPAKLKPWLDQLWKPKTEVIQ